MTENESRRLVGAWEGRLPPAIPARKAPEVFLVLGALLKTTTVVNRPKPVPEPYRSQPPKTLINGLSSDKL